MKTVFAAAALAISLAGALVLIAPDAGAMGSDPAPAAAPKASNNAKQEFDIGKQAIQAGQYDKGIESMKKVVAIEPKNADAYNYLGFAYRKKGDTKAAGMNYETALKIDPNHKGALEYQGELFMKLGKFEDMMKNRAKLEVLCPTGCAELSELDRAIADQRSTGGAT